MPANIERRSLRLGDQTLDYLLERKRVRNVNLRIRPDGSVYVSAAREVPLFFIEAFIRRSADRILRELHHAEEREKTPLTLWGKPLSIIRREGARSSARLENGTLMLTLQNEKDEPPLIEEIQKAETKRVVTELCQRYYPLFEQLLGRFPSLRFQRMRSRWGSCRPQKCAMSFNTRLCELPLSCAEYVVVHEFCHFLHPDHSPAFHEAVRRVLPDEKERRRLLRAWERRGSAI